MNAITATSQPFGVPRDAIMPDGSRRPAIRLNGHMLLFGIAIGLAIASASECGSVTHLSSLMYGALLWIWWAVVATILLKLSQRWPAVTSFAPRTIAVHMAAGSVLSYVHLLLLWSICFPSASESAAAWRYLFNINRFGIEFLLYGFVFGITGVIQFQLRAQREAIRSLELERQLSAAHLQALQMQLEPHFLFNTLNAITTLVEFGRQQQASEMLRHLNSILKATLRRTTPEKVPLSQELEIVENYLAIEQVRFADRLRLDFRVDPNALDAMIPCFLLQPIVENAIRHGIANCENDGLIEAQAKREGRNLHLRVCDSGRPQLQPLPSLGHGIGLKNTRARLAHFYPDSHTITAQPISAGGFEVSITIPYEPLHV